MQITFSSWRFFADFINQRFLDYKWFIFRGQASESWKLDSTLDRALRALDAMRSRSARKEHLQHFISAARGRRGPNPPAVEHENSWWALGQHHGLLTPLLDWTESPFVALYFAFEDETDEASDYRVVYGLSVPVVQEKSAALRRQHKKASKHGRPPIVEIIRPISDENTKLVNQRGLFTRAPDGMTIDSWVSRHFRSGSQGATFITFRIPNKTREQCLRFLNRMNINHLSLFPDLYGASKYCNYDLTIDGY